MACGIAFWAQRLPLGIVSAESIAWNILCELIVIVFICKVMSSSLFCKISRGKRFNILGPNINITTYIL